MEELKKTVQSQDKDISRRKFIGGTAAAGAAFTIVPRQVLGGPGNTAPSDKLNIATIGAGGMGAGNTNRASTENIVALCDVDDARAAGSYERYPNAKRYHDYRVMLEKQKDIDAVIVATPDHSHAPAAMMAIKAGKHVYVQKPMAHTVYEARKLAEAAREAKVITQMGNQGHSGEGVRLICEWIWDGAIGDVREVAAWTNRPVWPQGLYRPREAGRVPDTLDWDLWLGPAPVRPYHSAYVPWSWRAWWDFGCGAIGDMACHVLDPVFSALKPGYPTSVEAYSPKIYTENRLIKSTLEETGPVSSMIHYRFPARKDMPAFKLTWYDGGLMPPRPEELEPGRRMGNGASGVLFIGDKGKLMCGEYGDSPRLIPETRMKEYTQPAQTLTRVPDGSGGHEQDWIRACKDGKPACSNFDYAGPMTETVLLGNVAIRANKQLDWDGENMKVLNDDDANKYIHFQYRDGWTL